MRGVKTCLLISGVKVIHTSLTGQRVSGVACTAERCTMRSLRSGEADRIGTPGHIRALHQFSQQVPSPRALQSLCSLDTSAPANRYTYRLEARRYGGEHTIGLISRGAADLWRRLHPAGRVQLDWAGGGPWDLLHN